MNFPLSELSEFRMSKMRMIIEQELLTLPEHLSSLPVLRGSYYSIFSFMCMFCRSYFSPFLLTIVSYVLLPYTDYDCPFGIFKLFFPLSELSYFTM
jgi:hypothetical protein